jgi:hypothetical protein
MPDRLRSILPHEIVDQVMKEMDGARARQLPAGVLEYRALELAAKGTAASDILQEIAAQHQSLWLGRESLRAGGRPAASDDEIEAAGLVLRNGADEEAICVLATATPADRSLAVPLVVVSTLLRRGLPAADVMAAMRVWIEGGATDTELHDLAGPPPRPELTLIRGATPPQPPVPLHSRLPPSP